ncbi:MAG: exodeoxyribonuclease VII small subunit [Coriobacteriales bacterium]|jgi:exodeoxyribonuclease VII small subunit
MAANDYESFGELRARLDQIVVEVRDKDLSLEKSLDLYEEAIKIGNRCAELVDKADYTDEEALAAKETIGNETPDVGLSGKTIPAEGDAPAPSDADTEEQS